MRNRSPSSDKSPWSRSISENTEIHGTQTRKKSKGWVVIRRKGASMGEESDVVIFVASGKSAILVVVFVLGVGDVGGVDVEIGDLVTVVFSYLITPWWPSERHEELRLGPKPARRVIEKMMPMMAQILRHAGIRAVLVSVITTRRRVRGNNYW